MDEKTIKTERIQYSEKCPICKKDIKGFSESQVIWNTQVHLERTHQLNQKDRQKILINIKKDINHDKDGVKEKRQ